MKPVPLTLAIGDYEHVRDLITGDVRPAGIELRTLTLPVEHIFARFAACPEWEVSEFSLAKFSAMVASGAGSVVGLPVFPSRVFRHSSIYVHRDSTLDRPEQLAGLRIGIPEWAQTASVYTRGMLHHQHGVDFRDVKWVQAGVNEPGRKEKVAVAPPEGVSIDRVTHSSLDQMLSNGELDAVLTARPPAGFRPGGKLRRLLSDPRAWEEDYYRASRVFPIMHVVALRSSVHETHPWVARNLTDAFETAKQNGLARLADVTASRLPLPWVADQTQHARELLGPDPWPYGLEANRPTLETFLSYAFEQGVISRALAPEDLFVPSTLTLVRV